MTLVLTCDALTPLISDLRSYLLEMLYFAIFVILLFESRNSWWLGSALACLYCLDRLVRDKMCDRYWVDKSLRKDWNISVMSASLSLGFFVFVVGVLLNCCRLLCCKV